MQNTEVALASFSPNFNIYVKAGTSIIPPPEPNNPVTRPASSHINIFLIMTLLCAFLLIIYKIETSFYIA